MRAIIIKDLQLPYAEKRIFNFGIQDFVGSNVQPPVYAGERILRDNGMREITQVQTYRDPDGSVLHMTDISFEFTQKAQPFIVSSNGNSKTIKVSDISFNTVKTMRKVSDSEYEVEFSLSKAINLFGEAYDEGVATKYRTVDYRVNDYNFDYFKVRILKYENGWSMASEDIQLIKKGFDPEQFKYRR